MTRRAPNKLRLCDVHRPKGNYPKENCPACMRASISFYHTTILFKLFPNIMKEDKDA